MGYKLVKFKVTPGENEQIDVTINVQKEPRSVIHGVVLDECNKPKKDAVVKLLKVVDCHSRRLEPITHTFTDEEGQFLFGPLCPGVEYVIKVWIAHINNRRIVIPGHCHDQDWHDDDCHDEHHHDEHCHDKDCHDEHHHDEHCHDEDCDEDHHHEEHCHDKPSRGLRFYDGSEDENRHNRDRQRDRKLDKRELDDDDD